MKAKPGRGPANAADASKEPAGGGATGAATGAGSKEKPGAPGDGDSKPKVNLLDCIISDNFAAFGRKDGGGKGGKSSPLITVRDQFPDTHATAGLVTGSSATDEGRAL